MGDNCSESDPCYFTLLYQLRPLLESIDRGHCELAAPFTAIMETPNAAPQPTNVCNLSPVGGANQNSFSQTTANGEQTTTRQWKLHELGLLIAAKRMEHEKSINLSARDRIKSADQKWREILSFLAKDGVVRQATQVKKRWEKLMTDFKKVYDYQSGQPSYYEMGSEDRKSRKLSVNLPHELFEGMECWLGNNRVIILHKTKLSTLALWSTLSRLHNLTESLALNLLAAPTLELKEDIPAEFKAEVDSPPENMEHSAAEGPGEAQRGRPPPKASHYTGVKKNRQDKLDEQFKKTTTAFLDFLGKDGKVCTTLPSWTGRRISTIDL